MRRSVRMRKRPISLAMELATLHYVVGGEAFSNGFYTRLSTDAVHGWAVQNRRMGQKFRAVQAFFDGPGWARTGNPRWLSEVVNG